MAEIAGVCCCPGRYHQAGADSFARALAGLGEKAIEAFTDALATNQDIGIRERAATSVKSGILQLSEIDIENRLAKLEEAYAEQNNDQ